MPDIENSRKTAEKGAEWVTVKQPRNSRKNTRNTRKTPENSQNSCFSGVSGVFPAVFRLFYRDPLGTLFGCFQCRAFATSVGGRRDCNFWGSGVGGSQTPLARLFETFRGFGVLGSVDGGRDPNSKPKA